MEISYKNIIIIVLFIILSFIVSNLVDSVALFNKKSFYDTYLYE